MTATQAIQRLWQQAFGAAREPDLMPCPVSGNNRVYLVTAGDQRAIAKCYFQGGPGSRDRLESEWQMLLYGAAGDIAQMPRPIARDIGAGIALQQALPGDKLAADRIGVPDIEAAAAFFRALNQPDRRRFATRLPEAQEACFSTDQHFAMVEQRLQRLQFAPDSDLDRDAALLVAEMGAFWQALRPDLSRRLARLGIAADQPLSATERCISPADFGFHNAIKGPDGVVRFFDFEYAGWDDPAKMLCDFFLAPALPVPSQHWDGFAALAFAGRRDADLVAARARLMLPLFALKWCCIMLNPFAPRLALPGRFANPGSDPVERKTGQLAKARSAFARLAQRDAVL